MSSERAHGGGEAHDVEAPGLSGVERPVESGTASEQGPAPPVGKRRRRTLRRRLRLLLLPLMGCALLAAVGWWWYSRPAGGEGGPDGSARPGARGQGGGMQGRALVVEVGPVRRGKIEQLLELTGEVVAGESVVIAAAKEGPITYCPWREGDSVTAGEKLIEIDREVHRAEVQAGEAALAVARAKLADLKAGPRPEEIQKAEANVQRWKATLAEARRNHQRHERLMAKNATSQQSLDQAQERMEVAEAELAVAHETLRMLRAGPTPTEVAVQSFAVEEAAARLALAKAHLEECVIAAPFDGIVTKVHVRAGDLATPRSPLMEMYAPASLVVRFTVPEAYAAAVRPGLSLRVMVDALAGRTFSAEVSRVYPQLDPAMRTRTVEARLVQQAEIFPHMFVRLALELHRAGDAVLIPADAVLTGPEGEHFVFVVDEGTARRTDVEIGVEQNRTVQVTDGLEPGRRVVVAGQAALRDGQEVRLAGQGRADDEPAEGKPPAGRGRGKGKGKPGADGTSPTAPLGSGKGAGR